MDRFGLRVRRKSGVDNRNCEGRDSPDVSGIVIPIVQWTRVAAGGVEGSAGRIDIKAVDPCGCEAAIRYVATLETVLSPASSYQCCTVANCAASCAAVVATG